MSRSVAIELEILESRLNPAGGAYWPNLAYVLPDQLQTYFGYQKVQVQDAATGQMVALDGAGQTVVIITEGNQYSAGYQGSVTMDPLGNVYANSLYTGSDLEIYSNAFGLTQFGSNPGEPFYLIVDGKTGATPTPAEIGNYTEAREYALDIDTVHGVVPKANVVQLICSQFAEAAGTLRRVLDQLEAYRPGQQVSVFSMSYNRQHELNQPDETTTSHNIVEAMRQFPGVTLCVSAGDNAAGYQLVEKPDGTTEYAYRAMGNNGNNPHILQVGGIEANPAVLMNNGTGMVWGNGASSPKATSGTGGGYSLAYTTGADFQRTHLSTRPNSVPPNLYTYFEQTLPTSASVKPSLVPSAGSMPRFGPDVALQASPLTGVNVIDSAMYGNEAPWAPEAVGGTSLATPVMASVLAMVNQGRMLRGLDTLTGATETLPMLYRAPSSVFHDVVNGSNGYFAGPGFDLATGLGTPNNTAFLSYMSGASYQAWVPVTVENPAADTQVALMDTFNGETLSTYTPFPGYRGPLSVGQGDLNGDGVLDLVMAPGAGAQSHVLVLDGKSLSQANPSVLANFFAYDPAFLGGVSVAIGQAPYGGAGFLVTGPLSGAGPHVRTFGPSGEPQSGGAGSFYAFSPEFLGGVVVSTGDLDADGIQEIIVGTASGSGAVAAFASDSAQVVASYFAFAPDYRGGLSLTVGDVNGDGFADITAAAVAGSNAANVYCPQLAKQVANYYLGGQWESHGSAVQLADTQGMAVSDILFAEIDGAWQPLSPLTGLPFLPD